MAIILTNADIVGKLKLLADEHLKADSGSITTAVSAKLVDSQDLTNYYICFISGSNAGVDRIITSFDDLTGTITFAALTDAVVDTDEFCICEKGFSSDIIQGIAEVKNDFRNKNLNIDLFLNFQTQLKELYLYKVLSIICGNLLNGNTDDDMYAFQHARFNELYAIEKSVLIADYDSSESGVIEDTELLTNVGQVGFTR